MLKTKEARKKQKTSVICHCFLVSLEGFVRGVTFPWRTQPLLDGSHFILSRLQ